MAEEMKDNLGYPLAGVEELRERIRELEQEIGRRDASRKELDARWVNLYDETRGLYLGSQALLAVVTQERDRLVEVFIDIEWCGLSDYCLLCGRTKTEGHSSECRIAAALHATSKAVKS